MVAVEISGSLIVQDGNLLMVFNEEREVWNVPSSEGESGELSADTAERAAEECTGCSSEAVKYRKKIKNEYMEDGEKFRFQPYSVEIEGEPEDVKWIELDELDSKKVAKPIENVADEIAEKL